jgi:hypothetical protein
MIRARAPFDLARAMLSRIKSSTAGLMLPSMTMKSTCGAAASFGCASTEKLATTKIMKSVILSVFTVHLFENFLDILPNKLLVSGVTQ